MLLRRQPDNTDDTITCGVVVDLSILSAILLRHLVLTEIESVIVGLREGPAMTEGGQIARLQRPRWLGVVSAEHQ